MSRSYFAIKSQNPGDQFIYFGTLCFWLLNLCGSNVQSDKKYDDPNTTSQTILLEMKNVGIDANVPPNKLRTGYGEYVCIVLSRLINKALERKKQNFKRVKPDKENKETSSNHVVDIEEEDMPDIINKEIDFGDNIGTDNMNGNQNNRGDERNFENNEDDEEEEDIKILHSGISKADWMRETERVSNKLKIDYESSSSYNNSEWRGHLEQVKKNDNSLVKSIPNSRSVLENLSWDIEKILEKITTKEGMISKNFSGIIKDYIVRKTENTSKVEEFNQLRNKVEKMEKDYEELEEKAIELQVIFNLIFFLIFLIFIKNFYSKKKKIDNVDPVDPSKINNIRTVIQKLSQEAVSFDMKINIVNHSLIGYRSKGINNINPDNFKESNNNLFDENL